MTIYYVIPFHSLVDFEKVAENFEPLHCVYGDIDISECTIKSPDLLPRFIIKFKFDCKVADAAKCETYLRGYLVNLLGELY